MTELLTVQDCISQKLGRCCIAPSLAFVLVSLLSQGPGDACHTQSSRELRCMLQVNVDSRILAEQDVPAMLLLQNL